MWLFTEAADKFDRLVNENDVFLEQAGTEAAADYLKDDGFVNTAKLGVIGIVHAIHTFSTPFSRAFIDTARLGDGIKKGGWGYGEDALRALVVAGPALKAVRMLAGTAKAADMIVTANNCTWVAAARTLRYTSVSRLFARVTDLARFSNLPLISAFRPRWIHEITPLLKQLGAEVHDLGSIGSPAFTTLKEVLRTARHTLNGVVMFSVEWKMPIIDKTGAQILKTVGHTLFARNGLTGVEIIDRSGKVVKQLAQLEQLYPGISNAVPYGSAAIIENAKIVTAMEWIVTPLAALALRVEPYLLRPAAAPLTTSVQPVPKAAPPATPKATGTLTETSVTLPAPCTKVGLEGPIICDPNKTVTYNKKTYLVRGGDSLYTIAQFVYKNGNRWMDIYRANRHILGPNPHDPRALKAGQELRIP